MSGSRIGIAGLGLIGGSIARRMRLADPSALLVGFDRDERVATRALELGIIDASVGGLSELAAQCELLVLAIPVDATVLALRLLADVVGPRLVVDVASVKMPLVADGSRVRNFVGTHPMAGRERSGIDAAQADLFEGATWAHTPHPEPALITRVQAFIVAMGARPLQIDPAIHDAVVAVTSHLPQALAVLLGAQVGRAATAQPHVFDLCGPGIGTMLRLTRSPQTVWAPIMAANAAAIAHELRELARSIDQVVIALEAGESSLLMSYFDSANETAAALEQRSSFAPRSTTFH